MLNSFGGAMGQGAREELSAVIRGTRNCRISKVDRHGHCLGTKAGYTGAPHALDFGRNPRPDAGRMHHPGPWLALRPGYGLRHEHGSVPERTEYVASLRQPGLYLRGHRDESGRRCRNGRFAGFRDSPGYGSFPGRRGESGVGADRRVSTGGLVEEKSRVAWRGCTESVELRAGPLPTRR